MYLSPISRLVDDLHLVRISANHHG